MPLGDGRGSCSQVPLSPPSSTIPQPLHVHDGPVSHRQRRHHDAGINKRRLQLPWYRLAGLTCLILSVQTFWTILMAHGTPYLQSLGLSESLTSIVWMGGPFGAVFLSPMLGAWSDGLGGWNNGKSSRMGRRAPFIVVGATGVAVCLIGLANVRGFAEFVGRDVLGLLTEFEAKKAFGSRRWASPWLAAVAIFWVYALNIFITSLQVGARSLIIDCVAPEQQKDASAWISRWSCSAAVFTFFLSSVDLPSVLPFLGSRQFNALSHIEILLLSSTVPLSLYCSHGLAGEPLVDQTRDQWEQQHRRPGFFGVRAFGNLYQTFKALPEQILTTFKIQLWAWNAWFPYLYYHTSWVGHLAFKSEGARHHLSSDNDNAASTDEDATALARIGSFAAFLYALVALACTVILPIASRRFPYLTVERLWLFSHGNFAAMMFLTLLARSVVTGTFLVAACGFSWAMTQWAPFSLIAVEVSRSEADFRRRQDNGWDDDEGTPIAGVISGDVEGSGAIYGQSNRNKRGGSGDGAQPRALGAGAVMGLHNVIMGVPQLIAGIQIALLFQVLGLFGVQDMTSWALPTAGLSALGAIWQCRKLIL